MTPAPARHRVVVVGGGFGGLYAVKGLAAAPVDITLIDRVNHHLFQPLLYQVATGIIDEGSVAPALRSVLRGQANVEVLLAEVTGFDLAARTVQALAPDERPLSIAYDTLVVATGVRTDYFGHDEWAGRRAGPEVARRRALAAQPHPRRLRDGRARRRLRRAPRLAHLRRGRRGADRRRADRRDRHARAPRAAQGLSPRLDPRGAGRADGRRPHHPAALPGVAAPARGRRPGRSGRRDPHQRAGGRDRRRGHERAARRRRDGPRGAAGGAHHHLGGRRAGGGGGRRPGGGRPAPPATAWAASWSRPTSRCPATPRSSWSATWPPSATCRASRRSPCSRAASWRP